MIYKDLMNDNLIGSSFANRLFTDVFDTLANEIELPNSKRVLSIDIAEDAKNYTIKANIPGIDPKDIELLFDSKTLIIKGDFCAQDSDEQVKSIKKERFEGQFERRVAFDKPIDIDSISAKGEYGVLTITLPKKEAAVVRKIEIN